MEHVFLDQRALESFRTLLLEMGNPLPDQFLELKGRIGAVVVQLDLEKARYEKFQELQVELRKRKVWDRRRDQVKALSARTLPLPGKVYQPVEGHESLVVQEQPVEAVSALSWFRNFLG